MFNGILASHCKWVPPGHFSPVVAAICWYQFVIYETGQANSNTTFNLDNLLSTDSLRNVSDVNFVSYALALVPSNPYLRETWLTGGANVCATYVCTYVNVRSWRRGGCGCRCRYGE